MKILVTGATGMIGRQLLPRLSAAHEVFALSRAQPPEPDSGPTWIQQDLTAPLEQSALPDRLDAIVHLAQSERYRDIPDGLEDIFAVNVQSTSRLLEYGRQAGIGSFVLASTGGLYGFAGKPISEEAPPVTDSPYFRSKLMAELVARDYSEIFRCSSLRFFFVYGHGKSRMLISRLAQSILTGEEIVVEGDPGLKVNPIYADDAAGAVEAALGSDEAGAFNVAGPDVVTITELAEQLASALGRDLTLRHEGTGPPGDLVADTARMQSALGFMAHTSLAEGLSSVARSFAVSERG